MSAPATTSGVVAETILGPHRLILGDCLAVWPGLGVVDHVVADPPYEAIMHEAKARAAQRRLRTDGGPKIRALDFAAIDPIRGAVAAQLAAGGVTGWALLFCSPEGIRPWADTINATTGVRYKRALCWVKPDSTPQLNGQGPGQGWEGCVAAWCGHGHSRWQAGGKRGVYTHAVNPPDRDGGHPTEKPWRLLAELLTDFTAPGDVVLDPFMGSGTTGVAAARTGRRFVGIEVNPDYYALAVRRMRAAMAEPDLFAAPPLGSGAARRAARAAQGSLLEGGW